MRMRMRMRMINDIINDGPYTTADTNNTNTADATFVIRILLL